MTWGIFKSDTVSESYKKMKAEALKGDQHKLDKNKNGKLDSEDFKKLRNEEAEQVEEGWDDMLKSVKDKQGTQPNGGSGKKQGTRYGGGKQKEDEAHERKEKKNESVEQIDELSKTTLGNYYNAAKQDNKDHADSRRSGDEHEAKWAKDRMVKRHTGMGAAKQRLNKEEVELEELEDGTFYDGSDMLGEAKERTSGSYQFTHKPGDAESEKKLADLKAQHKGTGKRVVLQGRLGKDNPNAHKYSKNAPKATYVNGKRTNVDQNSKSGAHSHQRIRKADAAHHDVYVYDKADTQYDYDSLISEVLSKDASAGKWISDFVHSDNPKFAGDSVEKRKERALAAYYSAKKNESTDYNFYAEYIEEAVQQDVVKMGAKEIKHANMKDKQQDAEVMEPHSEGEADFLDKHSIAVTDDPTAVKQNDGAGSKASEPKGQGAGSYNGDSKLSDKDKAKVTVKEASACEDGTTKTGGKAEVIDTKPKEKDTKKNNS